MAVKGVKKLLVWWVMALFAGMPAYASDDLLSEDVDASDYLFTDETFLASSVNLTTDKPVQLSVEYTLAVNPKAGFKRTDHYTDLRLSSEAPLGLLIYAELELKATQYWQGDTQKPVKGDFSLLGIERLVLHYSLAETSVKLGSYILSWGEVEGAGVLDVINPAPSLTSSVMSLTPQWLVSGRYYMPSARASWFVGLDPSVTPLPGIRLTTSVAKEWGAKYGYTGAGSDWAIYAGRMVPNSPVLNLATTTASAKPYQLIGYSWNKAIDDDLIKFDLAYKRGLEHNLGYTGLTSDNRIDTAVGIELNHGDRQWNANLTAQHWLNYKASYITPAAAPVASNRTDLTYTLGVNDHFNNDQYSWSLTHVGTPNAALRALTGAIAWEPTDLWQSSLSYSVIAAKNNTAYASLDGTQGLILRVKLSY
jgi:hypothetical protein